MKNCTKCPADYKLLKGFRSHGQKVYKHKKKRLYITRDIGSGNGRSHKGGAWKMAIKPEYLLSKKTRLGTYNEDLSIRIGD
ncbi:hypothetical protein CLPU_6c00190 [Gottschalkia purinilytica]|uniref:Novel toxin 21 domain-containing protein n=1 Tax=Gottschalkia purinilytica TaxID=1503 RepID=A0A0L0WAI4_GOTPU|nr:toxin C-terminal domain-containing protein [Gottschalkia purinilytica]KNF08533.1 hypothetical protein CLPU_6c00190 [Gottschalkia purinilytica]